MLISEIFEAQGFWRGVGKTVGQRYTPGFDFGPGSQLPTAQKAARRAGQALGRVLNKTPSQAPAATPASVPPARDYSQYQTPTVFRQGTQIPAAAATPATTAPTSDKPRVSAQPIRVGNKVYRPGDPMHARLSQMMQAQQRS